MTFKPPFIHFFKFSEYPSEKKKQAIDYPENERKKREVCCRSTCLFWPIRSTKK